MSTSSDLAIAPARYVRIKAAAVSMGTSEGAIRKRIERGIWIENVHWRRAPDGTIWIDMKGIEQWVESTV